MNLIEEVLEKKRGRRSLLANKIGKTPRDITYAISKGTQLSERLQILITEGAKELLFISKDTTYKEAFLNKQK